MRHPPPASGSSPERPQVPGRTPLPGTTSAEDQPPTLLGCVPPARPREAPAREAEELSGPARTLLVCCPLRLEARAVRRGLPGPASGSVRVTGYGQARSRRQAQALAAADFGALAIAGVGGGLTADLAPGDLGVGTEVSDGHGPTRCAAAPLLAGELRRAGLRAVAGPVVTVDRLAGGAATRQRLAAGGALLAGLESAPLAPAP